MKVSSKNMSIQSQESQSLKEIKSKEHFNTIKKTWDDKFMHQPNCKHPLVPVLRLLKLKSLFRVHHWPWSESEEVQPEFQLQHSILLYLGFRAFL